MGIDRLAFGQLTNRNNINESFYTYDVNYDGVIDAKDLQATNDFKTKSAIINLLNMSDDDAQLDENAQLDFKLMEMVAPQMGSQFNMSPVMQMALQQSLANAFMAQNMLNMNFLSMNFMNMNLIGLSSAFGPTAMMNNVLGSMMLGFQANFPNMAMTYDIQQFNSSAMPNLFDQQKQIDELTANLTPYQRQQYQARMKEIDEQIRQEASHSMTGTGNQDYKTSTMLQEKRKMLQIIALKEIKRGNNYSWYTNQVSSLDPQNNRDWNMQNFTNWTKQLINL